MPARGAGSGRAWLALALLALLTVPLGARPLRAEDEPPDEDVVAKSFPLRKRLHQYPTLASPLEHLVKMFRADGKLEQLIAMYRSHVGQWPDDLPGRIVYCRLLTATHDPAALSELRSASTQHADNAYLRYLLFRQLSEENDPEAVAELDRAIDLESVPRTKRQWIDQLLEMAVNEDRHDLARKHLTTYATLLANPAEGHLAAARRMHELGFHTEALTELDAARVVPHAPEQMVEGELLAANVEVALKRHGDAAKRLDTLLGRLTADYWRRSEILRRRARLVATHEEREAMVRAARDAARTNPKDESAALDLARLLRGFERHREALETLLAAGTAMPGSNQIEQEILGLYDRLRDERGREAYLAARRERMPDREDLAERHIRSLFLLGRREAARTQLEALLADATVEVRTTRMLEMARYLRSGGLTGAGARIFEQVVAMAPERLDIRRELAECHLMAGDRTRARKVLEQEIVPEAADDAFLDLVQLMLQSAFFVEARRALEQRLELKPENLEMHLALLRVYGYQGRVTGGTALIDRARPFADTGSRYRRWLDEATGFHAYFRTLDRFLDEEGERVEFEGGPWTGTRLDRLSAFAEVSTDNRRAAYVADMLARLLELDMPQEARIELKRRLALHLESDRDGEAAAAEQLEELIDRDAAHKDEYLARLALIRASQERMDLAKPLLDRIEIRQIKNPRLLERLEAPYRDVGDHAKVLEILERLTIVDAAEREHWESWTAALTGTGQERELRRALRQILRGVARLEIDRATRDLLTSHLADSYWRSIGRLLRRGGEANLLEVLALLDQAERLADEQDLPLWVLWTRAYTLGRLGRPDGRDAVIGELERLTTSDDAGTPPAAVPLDEIPPGDDQIPSHWILFPDGLAASWECARALLGENGPRAPETPPAVDRRGPGHELSIRWAFRTGGAAVTSIQPLGDERLLIADSSGDLYGVERQGGKLAWHLPSALSAPVAPAAPGYPGYAPPTASYLQPVPRPVVGPHGSFCLATVDGVECRGADSALRWKLSLGGGALPHTVLVHDDVVIAYDAGGGEVVAVDATTGKLRWSTTLPQEPETVQANGAGAALVGDRLLVYGPRCAILNATNGWILWVFDPGRVNKLPFRLEEPEPEDGPAAAGSKTAGAKRTTKARSKPNPYATAVQSLVSSVRGSSQPFYGRLPPGYAVSPGTIHLSGVSYVAGPGGITFVPAHGLSVAGWSPPALGAQTAVVAPAVAWSAPMGPMDTRYGTIAHGKLVLCRNSWPAGTRAPSGRITLLDLALPMYGGSVDVVGTPIGFYGGSFCLLQRDALVTVDLERRTVRSFDLGVVLGSAANAPVQAAMDGAYVYVTGPEGVVCVNVPTQREMFTAPWPEGLVFEATPLAQQVHLFRGLLETVNAQAPPAGLRDPRCYADRGVLYVAPEPHRVVALEGREAREKEGGSGGR